jgi:hypothetical protein
MHHINLRVFIREKRLNLLYNLIYLLSIAIPVTYIFVN